MNRIKNIMITNIETLKAFLEEQKTFFANDLIAFMVVVRIEIQDVKQKQSLYPTLNLFCNWCLHNQISASLMSISLFHNFIEALCDYDTNGTTKLSKFNTDIIDSFITEIILFLEDRGICADYFKKENEKIRFFGNIVRIIKNRQMYLPNSIKIKGGNLRKIKSISKKLNKLITCKNEKPSAFYIKVLDNGEAYWVLDTTRRIDFYFPLGYGDKQILLPNI